MTTWPMLTLLLVMGVVVLADDSVRLLTKSTSTLTSSTLRWVHGNQAASFMTEMVRGAIARPQASADYAADATTEDDEVEEEAPVLEVDQAEPLGHGEESILVCRARYNGDLLPGALIRDECMVSLARQVARYKRYDVLRNVEGSSRLQWRHWTRFNGKPAGAVSADGQGYVARRRAGADAEHSHYLGRLDLSVGLGRVYVMEPDTSGSWVEKDYLEGEVLVELEPLKYELQNVVLNDRRVKLQQRPRVLADTVLRREAENQQLEEDQLETNDATPPQSGDLQLVATALTYFQEPSSEYWGQGRGMLRGLNTAIHIQSEPIPRVIEWGVNSTHPGSEQAVTVQAKLPPGTGQNVTVTGNHTTSETPYTALLIAHYKDGVTRSRTINGTVNQVSLQGVKVIYGAHYFLHDGSLVPTTTTTTTTPSSTTSSTTPSTTTTTSTTAKAAGESQVIYEEAPVAMSTGQDVTQRTNVPSPSAAPVSCRQSFMIVIACLLVIGFRSGT